MAMRWRMSRRHCFSKRCSSVRPASSAAYLCLAARRPPCWSRSNTLMRLISPRVFAFAASSAASCSASAAGKSAACDAVKRGPPPPPPLPPPRGMLSFCSLSAATSSVSLDASLLSTMFSFFTLTSCFIRYCRSSSPVAYRARRPALPARRASFLAKSMSAIPLAQSTSASSCRAFVIHVAAPSSFLIFSRSSSVCTSKRRALKARSRSFSWSCMMVVVAPLTRSRFDIISWWIFFREENLFFVFSALIPSL
mmetsp:Transcript_52393/g.104049  ORF Transcript_52393/g.104049 Transcript_52393/m.104049 type:complete len:252 (-) Transcript_52393:338-1093(-)